MPCSCSLAHTDECQDERREAFLDALSAWLQDALPCRYPEAEVAASVTLASLDRADPGRWSRI